MREEREARLASGEELARLRGVLEALDGERDRVQAEADARAEDLTQVASRRAPPPLPCGCAGQECGQSCCRCQ